MRSTAESYVLTVICRTSLLPPPSMPTGTSKARSSWDAHWCSRSIVGTTTSVDRRTAAIARNARKVLPEPVGMATMPRHLAASQADSAALWWGIGLNFVRSGAPNTV